jgi:hypothetical protein
MASAPFQPQPAVKHRTTSLLLRHVAGASAGVTVTPATQVALHVDVH